MGQKAQSCTFMRMGADKCGSFNVHVKFVNELASKLSIVIFLCVGNLYSELTILEKLKKILKNPYIKLKEEITDIIKAILSVHFT